MSLSQLPAPVLDHDGKNKTLEEIIGKAFLEAKETCTSPWVLRWSATLPGLPIDFHELMTILAAVACLFNCMCAIYLVSGHLVCWVHPKEQKQHIRVILFNIIFSITGFFNIYFYTLQGYIHPVAVWYEGLAMTALFLLYVQLLCPNEQDRAQYFASLQRILYTGKVKGDKGSLRWFHIIWILVFQVTFTRIITFTAAEIIESVTCPLSKTRSYANILIQVIQGVSTSLTVTAIIMFEKRMHSRLANHGHRPLLKLVSFKAIVGLEATQDILFSVLGETGVYYPGPPYHVSYSDFAVGIPQFILVWEMTVVIIAFMWSYTFEDYRRQLVEGSPIVAPTWRAFLDVLDLTDIYRGVKYMFTCLTSSTYLEGIVDGRMVQGLHDKHEHHQDDQSKALSFQNKIEGEDGPESVPLTRVAMIQ